MIRSLIENTFGLLYLIEKDEELRSYSFLICQLHKEIKYYKQFIKEEDISKNFIAKFIKQEPNFKIENYCNPNEVKRVIEFKESLLKEVIYKKEDIEFHRTCNKNKRRNNNPHWYSLYDGPTNFENLCLYLNNSILYEFQYRKYSEYVHQNNALTGLVITGKDKADMLQIRNFKDCKEVFYKGVNLLIDVYKEFIKMRLPEKQNEFDKWYLNYVPEFNKTDLKTKFNYLE